MEAVNNKIECPACGTEIDVNEVLSSKVEGEYRKKYSELKKKEEKLSQEKQEIEKKIKEEVKQKLVTELERKEKEIQNVQKNFETKKKELELDYKKTLSSEKLRLEKEAKQKIEEENSERIKMMEEELKEKASKVSNFNKLTAELEIQKSKNKEFQTAKEAEVQKAVAEERRKKEKKREQEKKEFEKELEDKLKSELLKNKEKLEEETSKLKSELEAKSKETQDFYKIKTENEKLKRKNEEMKYSIEAEMQKKMNEDLQKSKEEIKKHEENKWQMKLAENENVINRLKEQTKELQREAEQGAVQLQGEVQELAIEEWLKVEFPLDTIEEIKKGARGADCLQIINSTTKHNCGKIYYESKRTKEFQKSWIEKFKGDMREKGVDTGVLVTEVMPNDMKRFGMKEGIWLCTFEEFKGLSQVLRESLIILNNAIASQENKGNKMNMLYGFLTSNEFRMQIEAIVEGFSQMKTDLESEKRSMARIWKQREKQIEKVVLNTTHMYGAIKGIAGNAIQPVTLLELPDGELG